MSHSRLLGNPQTCYGLFRPTPEAGASVSSVCERVESAVSASQQTQLVCLCLHWLLARACPSPAAPPPPPLPHPFLGASSYFWTPRSRLFSAAIVNPSSSNEHDGVGRAGRTLWRKVCTVHQPCTRSDAAVLGQGGGRLCCSEGRTKAESTGPGWREALNCEESVCFPSAESRSAAAGSHTSPGCTAPTALPALCLCATQSHNSPSISSRFLLFVKEVGDLQCYCCCCLGAPGAAPVEDHELAEKSWVCSHCPPPTPAASCPVLSPRKTHQG